MAEFTQLVEMLVLAGGIIAVVALIFTGIKIITSINEKELAEAKKRFKNILFAIIILGAIGLIGSFIIHNLTGTLPSSTVNGTYDSQAQWSQLKWKRGIAGWLLNIVVALIGWFVELIANTIIIPIASALFRIVNSTLFTVPDPFFVAIAGRSPGYLIKTFFIPIAGFIMILAFVMAAIGAFLNHESERQESIIKGTISKFFVAILALLMLGAFVYVINGIVIEITKNLLYATKLPSLYSVQQAGAGARINVGIGDIIFHASDNLINAVQNWAKNPNGQTTLVDAFTPYVGGGLIQFDSPYQSIAIGVIALINLGFAIAFTFYSIFRLVYYYVILTISPIAIALYMVPGQDRTFSWWVKEYLIVSFLPAWNALVFFFMFIVSDIVNYALGLPILSGNVTVTTIQAVAISLSYYIGSMAAIYLMREGKAVLNNVLQTGGNILSQASAAAGQLSSAIGSAVGIASFGGALTLASLETAAAFAAPGAAGKAGGGGGKATAPQTGGGGKQTQGGGPSTNPNGGDKVGAKTPNTSAGTASQNGSAPASPSKGNPAQDNPSPMENNYNIKEPEKSNATSDAMAASGASQNSNSSSNGNNPNDANNSSSDNSGGSFIYKNEPNGNNSDGGMNNNDNNLNGQNLNKTNNERKNHNSNSNSNSNPEATPKQYSFKDRIKEIAKNIPSTAGNVAKGAVRASATATRTFAKIAKEVVPHTGQITKEIFHGGSMQ